MDQGKNAKEPFFCIFTENVDQGKDPKGPIFSIFTEAFLLFLAPVEAYNPAGN